ncbi:MAG: PAS domain-containing sensor histidine kinase, partial [Vicinamibacterales bacterium]
MRHTAERTAALEHEVRTRQEAEHDARNARARNEAILDVALDCVILMDENGHIAQFNPAAETTFGYTAAEAVGTGLVELIIPPDKRDACRAAFADYLTTGDTGILNRRFELTAIRRSGEEFPVEVAVAPISSDGGRMLAGYMRDITERKRAERELASYTHDLEAAHDTQRKNAEQLAVAVDQLRVTQRHAEAATRAKSEFLASMSHELRTPLNAIILYSELLQEVAEDEGHKNSVGDLQRIQSAGKHLLDLINGILDLSKIEAGKMALSLERFDVRSMINELLDTVAPLVQKNNNTLTVRCDVNIRTMYGDLTKTRQILLNLLSNASKFTREGSIAVEARQCSFEDIKCVEFSVTDTGVGMTLEQTHKVFDPFTQADVTTTRKYGGTGLGLAIVSRFCELMSGSISVDSRPGEGSRFTVLLPLEMVDQAVSESVTPAGVA